MRLLAASASSAVASSPVAASEGGNKKAKQIPDAYDAPAAPPAAPAASFSLFDLMDAQKGRTNSDADATAAAAPKSFSLFDLLDSQKGGGGGFSLPPRIMSHQVIEAHRSEKRNGGISTSLEGGLSALELLERAEDVEDLSPDLDSWDEVRSILYEGLLTSSVDSSVERRTRYLRVHEALFDRCRRNNACVSQLWGLAQNLAGAVLAPARQFRQDLPVGPTMDLRWDIMHSLLGALSHLAAEHVASAVGNEREVERMLLGMCLALSEDVSACIAGMMEPNMADAFEIWSRFVDPPAFLTIVRASGLGGAVLRRCECLGRDRASEGVWNAVRSSVSGGVIGASRTPSLADFEHCNFLQSLSVLRTILFRCGGSRGAVSLIHDQFFDEPKEGPITLSSFLLPNGVASLEAVESRLKEVRGKQCQCSQMQRAHTHKSMNSVLKPFRDVISARESDVTTVSRDLEVLCSQTIGLIQQLTLVQSDLLTPC